MTRAELPPPTSPLEVAVRERAVVARATGVVMVTHACSVEEALRLLGTTAAAERRPLPAVAAAVVAAVPLSRT